MAADPELPRQFKAQALPAAGRAARLAQLAIALALLALAWCFGT